MIQGGGVFFFRIDIGGRIEPADKASYTLGVKKQVHL
jgi:hypothetical protein